MRFNLLKLATITFLITSCKSETTPRHQTALKEDQQRPVVVHKQNNGSDARYNSRLAEIEALVATGYREDLLKALSMTEDVLFSPSAMEVEVYTSNIFFGYLDAYVDIFKKWDEAQKEKQQSSDVIFSASFEKFRKIYVESCIDPQLRMCELMRSSLKREKAVVALLLYYAQNESDLRTRLSYLGAGYDVSGHRRERRLERMYVEAVIQLERQENATAVTVGERRVHGINAMNILLIKQGEELTEQDVDLFETLKVWDYAPPLIDTMDFLREALMAQIPVYAQKRPSIVNKIREKVAEKLDALLQGRRDLQQYPAYKDINLNDLKEQDPLVVFLLLNVYTRVIDTNTAGFYLSHLPHRNESMEVFFKDAKEIVRWDIAQTSLESTQRLNAFFSEQEAKTPEFVQTVVDKSAELKIMWNDLHSNRIKPLRSFLEANKAQAGITDEQIRLFFGAINRNILKTAVYPNMLGFFYYMAKTEWKVEIRFGWRKKTIDTTVMFDYFLTGQYSSPWFDFTNQSDSNVGDSADTQSSLLRSEMMDSVYYFFATHAHEVYGIDPDDFLQTVGETVMKLRQPYIDSTLQAQESIYFTEDNAVDRFMKWCRSIEAGRKIPENIHFYQLFMTTLPLTDRIRTVDQNSQPSLFYGDYYKSIATPVNIYGYEMNDRFKLEVQPIVQVYSQMVNIAERLGAQNPQAHLGRVPKSREYLEFLENQNRGYWGSQITIYKKMQDCDIVAADESRRRARGAAMAEYTYERDVVNPLMAAIAQGKILVSEANDVIRQIHTGVPFFDDKIVQAPGGTITYQVERMTFMGRVRMYFTEGLHFEGLKIQGETIVEPVNVPAVVGSHLSIPYPQDMLNDTQNPYTIQNAPHPEHIFLDFIGADRGDSFASAMVNALTDSLRVDVLVQNKSQKMTTWDEYESGRMVEFNRWKVELLAQLYQLGNITYLDYFNEACRQWRTQEVPRECYRQNSTTALDLAKAMEKIYSYIELDEEEQRYMEMINGRGYLSDKAVGLQLKYDSTVPYGYSGLMSPLPYQRLQGLFDRAAMIMNLDYAGFTLRDSFDLYRDSYAGGNAGDRVDYSCEKNRSGCYWKAEKEMAKQFYTARIKRPGLMFRFDQRILEEDYRYHYRRVHNKFRGPMELNERGKELLEEVRQGKPRLFKADMIKEAEELYPLSVNFMNARGEFDKYMNEETEGFYLNSVKDWKAYMEQGY